MRRSKGECKRGGSDDDEDEDGDGDGEGEEGGGDDWNEDVGYRERVQLEMMNKRVACVSAVCGVWSVVCALCSPICAVLCSVVHCAWPALPSLPNPISPSTSSSQGSLSLSLSLSSFSRDSSLQGSSSQMKAIGYWPLAIGYQRKCANPR